MNEVLHKEIDLIQSCISRMAQNSFTIKGLSLTCISIVGAVLASQSWYLIALLIIPIIGFWWLDAYYLHQEKLYRKLYDWVIAERPNGTQDYLYDLCTDRFSDDVIGIWGCMKRKINTIFYGVLILMVICFILFQCLKKPLLRVCKSSDIGSHFISFNAQFGYGEIISLLCLIGSIYLYFKFNRKLNRQQKIINDQQIQLNNILLEQEQQSKIDNQKAQIVVSAVKTDKWHFIIANKGKSEARNIMISGLTDQVNLGNLKDIDLPKLSPNQERNVTFSPLSGIGDNFECEVSWEDDFKSENKDTFIVYMNK